ncbi:MAG: alpha/beta hydrolase [Caulobacter sp.]|nr:alpha/beta hydrolase [Caulobacter sp.]
MNALVQVPTFTTPASARPRRPVRIETPDGVRLFHRDWGEGRPVVFLHGWALTADMWNYQVEPLHRLGLRCIAYDRRGHGRSEDPGFGYDYDTLADDLEAVLAALDLRDVVLVGHSMAGGELVRYMTRHGDKDRVAKLLFLSPALPCLLKSPDNPDGIDRAVFDQVREHGYRRDYAKWLKDNEEPFFVPETSRAMRDWIGEQMRQVSPKAMLDCNLAMIEADFRPELAQIDLPSLVIHGDRDVSAPLERTGARAAALIPGAELRVYEDAPHGLFVTHMDRLNADILAFAVD